MVSLEIDTFTEVGSFLRERLKQAGFNSIKDLAIRGPIDIAKSADIEINEAISLCNNATIRLEELGSSSDLKYQ
jgi:hypothetical protein